MPLAKNAVDPGRVIDYINVVGLQNSTRFAIEISDTSSGKPEYSFLCDMVQIPSKNMRIKEDYLSGMASPIPAIAGYKIQSNMFQFVIEEMWLSRTYFEKWFSGCFTKNKVKLIYDPGVLKNIEITALSEGGSGGDPEPTAIYTLYECAPVSLIPSKLDASSLNTAARFQVTVMPTSYQYRPTVKI